MQKSVAFMQFLCSPDAKSGTPDRFLFEENLKNSTFYRVIFGAALPCSDPPRKPPPKRAEETVPTLSKNLTKVPKTQNSGRPVG